MVLKDQDLLGDGKDWDKVVGICANSEPQRAKLKKDLHKAKDSVSRWNELSKHIDSSQKRDVIFQLLYPRMDVHVSTGLNHLLKSPFCVHPKTGRICVPVNPEKVDDFNPEEVPTVYELIDDIDSYAGVDKASVPGKAD